MDNEGWMFAQYIQQEIQKRKIFTSWNYNKIDLFS